MKVYISVDIEGVTGVTSWKETGAGGDGYERACKQMTAEVAAACKGAMKAGASKVLVKDSHGSGRNIYHEDLPKGVELIRGWCSTTDEMMAGVDRDCDLAFLVGYHSGSGSDKNPLSHTMNTDFAEVSVNGNKMSEMDFSALICAKYDVPIALVTGDKGLCDMAAERLPWALTVPVKEGIGEGTLNIHPEEAISKIEQKAYEAVKAYKGKSLRVLDIEEKYELVVKYKHHFAAKRAANYPHAYRIDDTTAGVTCATLQEMLVAFTFMHGE